MPRSATGRSPIILAVAQLICSAWALGCSDDDAERVRQAQSGNQSIRERGPKPDVGTGMDLGTADGGRDAAIDAASSMAPAQPEADLAALRGTGLDKYVGAARPSAEEQLPDETHFSFDVADGPACLRGAQYAMGVRQRDSENLLIYLQGGGACTNAVCKATETANPKLPHSGLLNPDDNDNPVADWNVVYVPYCDGSLLLGDSELPEQNRIHHGLRNLTAALEVGVAKLPKPRRILLAGASAGGYGTIWGSSLVRLLYPDASLYVLNDAGIGIGDPDHPEARRASMLEWNTAQFVPASCSACQDSAHLTPWMTWNLERDPGLKLALFSAYQDSVITGTFLMIDPPVFERALREQTERVVNAAPERAKRFLIKGTQHTIGSIHTTHVGDESAGRWLTRMLAGDPDWQNVLE
jgi:hypothetical protein